MIIKSIHIDNFGKLSNYDYTFDRGLNTFCEENGYGKSTLASFLKVMFYGFAGEGKRSNMDKERHRFKPWQGGTYGGWVSFQVGERSYILSRVFGSKSADDEIQLVDERTGLLSDDYKDNIGEQLFDLDEEAFKKSIFISQLDLQGSSLTGKIGAKIGNIGGDNGDLDQFESTDQTLKRKMDALTPKRSTGEIAKLVEQKNMLQRSSEEKLRIESIMGQVREDKSELVKNQNQIKKDIEEVQKKQKENNVLQERMRLFKQLSEIESALNEASDNFAKARKAFPGDIPDKSEVTDVSNILLSFEDKKNEEKRLALTEQEERLLDEGNRLFAEMDATSFDVMQDKAKQLMQLKEGEAALRLTEAEKIRYKELSGRFGGEAFPKASLRDLAEVKRKDEKEQIEIAHLLTEIKKAEDDIGRKKQAAPKKSGAFLLILSLLLLLGGACLSVFYLYIGIGVSLLGLLLLVVALVTGKQSKKNLAQYEEDLAILEEEKSQLQESYEQREKLHKQYTDKLQAGFQRYGEQYDEVMASNVISELTSLAFSYEDLRAKAERAQSSDVLAKQGALRGELTGFLSRFQKRADDPEFYEVVTELKNQYYNYVNLNERKSEADKTSKEAKELDLELVAFLQKYGLHNDDNRKDEIYALPGKIELYMERGEAFDRARQKREAFIENYGEIEPVELADELPDASIFNEQYDSLSAKLDEINVAIQAKDKQHQDLAEKYDSILEDASMLEVVSASIEEKTRLYHTIEKTRKYLALAKDNLVSRYRDPLKNAFLEYYTIVSGSDGSNISIDAEANVKVREQGLDRETYYFSEGYKDLMGFCMRLAYTDAMYQEEKPFLIMDDPFVNLDDEKREKAESLLSVLAEKYQLIFFTCHGLRKDRVL